MDSALTIVSGCSVWGYSNWYACKKGRRGRLSPKFKKYDDLLSWLIRNGHL